MPKTICRICEREAGIRIPRARYHDCRYHELEAVTRLPFCRATISQRIEYRFWRLLRGECSAFGAAIITANLLLLAYNIIRIVSP